VGFSLSTRQGRNCSVVEVTGDLDMGTTPQLRDQLHEVIQGGARSVVVDLAGVGFMDSSALGALVVAFKDLRQRGGRLSLAAVRRPVRTVLSITSVDQIIDSYDTAVEAEEASAPRDT